MSVSLLLVLRNVLEGELADVPTFQEEGIDAEFTIWRGLFGPKEMSDAALTIGLKS